MPIVPCSNVDYFLDDISHWMTDSRLKPNADKTEFLVTGTHRQRKKVRMFSLYPYLVSVLCLYFQRGI